MIPCFDSAFRCLLFITHVLLCCNFNQKHASIFPFLFSNVCFFRTKQTIETGTKASDNEEHISPICDKGFTTQSFGIFELSVQKETFTDAFLTGIVSKHSLQNSPLESSCVVVAPTENYSNSKPFNFLQKNNKLRVVTLLPQMSDIFNEIISFLFRIRSSIYSIGQPQTS